MCIFTGFLLVIHIYTHGSLKLTSILGTIIELLVAYLILQTVGKDFIETYLKVIVFLAVWSLFGFMTDQLNLFDGLIQHLLKVGSTGYEGILYTYRYHYAGYERNNSIFFEPGAYQGFLNAALYMLLFMKTKFTPKQRWLFVGILLVALYTTGSTTGYLIFALLFGVFLFKSGTLSGAGKVALLGALTVVTLIFSAEFHSVIFDKIGRYLSIQAITDNDTHKRSFDMLVDIEIFKRNLFGVGYQKYWQIFSEIGQVSVGNTSSNGVTKIFAVFGLPFGLFLFGSYYWALSKLSGSIIMGILLFIMLLMFFVGEAYYVLSPACLAIIVSMFMVYPEAVIKNHEPRICSSS